MTDYRQLRVWQKAHAVVLRIYKETAGFPPEERFGLTAQMRRSAASVPTNIAEGAGRGSNAMLAQFVSIAAGSASELDYQLLMARDLGFMGDEVYNTLVSDVSEVRRMLSGLLRTLRENR